MRIHRISTHVLIVSAVLVAGGCSSINPGHVAKFTFMGTVNDEQGKPVSNAWVKVRGWETLTDKSGKWTQVQVVNCGTLREHMDTYEENDAALISADGYVPNEEFFVVRHPGYFQGCTPEQTVRLDTVLKKKVADAGVASGNLKKVPTPPTHGQGESQEESNEPAPAPTPERQNNGKHKRGTYTL